MRRRRARQPVSKAYGDFMGCLALVEEAKEALVAAVPSARRPGLPVAEALAMFELALRDAQKDLDRWRFEGVETEWAACRAAITQSLARSERLRLEAPDLDFEGLLSTVSDLIEPLEAFGEAEDAFIRRWRAG